CRKDLADDALLIRDGEGLIALLERLPAGSVARTLLPPEKCPVYQGQRYLVLGKRDAVLWLAEDVVQRTGAVKDEQDGDAWAQENARRAAEAQGQREHRTSPAGLAERLARAEAEVRQLKALKQESPR